MRSTFWLIGLFLLSSQNLWGASALPDPIPEKIIPGDILVIAKKFVRAPRTEDSAPGGNDAYARIQYLAAVPGIPERLVFNDTRGLLYITDVSGSQPAVFLDLRKYGGFGFDDSMFPNETGLAAFAFHPDYADPQRPGFGKFYTAYSARPETGKADYLDDDSASHESVIREWTMRDPNATRFSGSSREVFRIGQFAPNHNVGTIAFNPNARRDEQDYGVLYAGFGDGGAANDPKNYSQNLTNPHGSIIRIDPLTGGATGRYGIPSGNPFVGRADVAPEIWAYGLRHPQHFSWDHDDRLFIADIGQNHVEEVNLGTSGANYGWRLREGTFATAYAVPGQQPGRVFPLPEHDEEGFIYPVAQYDHDEGNAIGGGFVYRGSAIESLKGRYVFTDLVRGRIFHIDADRLSTGPSSPAEIRELRIVIDGKEQPFSSVAGFPNTYAQGLRVDLRMGIDAAGELYLLTKGDGWIRKLLPMSSPD